ncbi:MAG TPA: 50S ribosomal protein L11 methyltransferase [Dehalococcoidia bacterium]|nr:50S ribosomal protein L11 methyltransferase [Dehalococcoidia bacterium]
MWLQLTLQVAPQDAEVVADVLRQRCPAVAIEFRGPFEGQSGWGAPAEDSPALDASHALVRVYLPEDEATIALRRSLRLALRFVPLTGPVRWRRARRLREDEWQRAWQKHLRARRAGRLLVRPAWSAVAARAGEVVVEIDPGLAFGTGEHPTTALCLRALSRLVKGGERVLDVGTGSGILAIAAARLGAASVLALDIDPQAVKAARDNARRNGVESVVEVRDGTLTTSVAEAGPFQLVCANIDGLTLERMAPLLAAALAPGGRMVISGFLTETAPSLGRTFEALGLQVEETSVRQPWAALVLARP